MGICLKELKILVDGQQTKIYIDGVLIENSTDKEFPIYKYKSQEGVTPYMCRVIYSRLF